MLVSVDLNQSPFRTGTTCPSYLEKWPPSVTVIDMSAEINGKDQLKGVYLVLILGGTVVWLSAMFSIEHLNIPLVNSPQSFVCGK